MAIIAVLALVVVPNFMSESSKARSSTEITPMFTELANREQQHKQEFGAYLVAAKCPSTPVKSKQDVSSCLAAATPWTTLRVVPHSMMLACTYEIKVGLKGVDPTSSVPTWAQPNAHIATNPAEGWFVILGECNADGDSVKAQFFTSSWDTQILSKDPAE